MRRYRSISTILLSILGALSVVGPLSAHEPLQSRDGVVRLSSDANGARVIDERGSSTPLALAEGVVAEDLAAMRTGWLLAGHELRGGETELYLRRLDAGGLRKYPVPGYRTGVHRTSPVLMTVDGELSGMVWLEGNSRQAYGVLASRWLGITWSEPTVLAPPDRGARLALDATVLDDGSWLVVWADWDGEDDEIVFSIVTGDGATPPRPLTDNTVPDILPTVLATAEGAVVAWNTFDGDGYRVTVLGRREGRWLEARRLDPETYFPYLVRDEEIVHLLYFERRPEATAWVVAELDDEGRVARRGRVVSDRRERPLLRRGSGGTELVFAPDDRRTTVAWETGR